MLQNFLQWLNGVVPTSPRADSVRRVVGRYARGNVLLQQGRYVSGEDAAKIVHRGDRALEKLDRLAKR